jgi:hypothetical protein
VHGYSVPEGERLVPSLPSSITKMAYDRRHRLGGFMSHARYIDKMREYFKAAKDGHGA